MLAQTAAPKIVEFESQGAPTHSPLFLIQHPPMYITHVTPMNHQCNRNNRDKADSPHFSRENQSWGYYPTNTTNTNTTKKILPDKYAWILPDKENIIRQIRTDIIRQIWTDIIRQTTYYATNTYGYYPEKNITQQIRTGYYPKKKKITRQIQQIL